MTVTGDASDSESPSPTVSFGEESEEDSGYRFLRKSLMLLLLPLSSLMKTLRLQREMFCRLLRQLQRSRQSTVDAVKNA